MPHTKTTRMATPQLAAVIRERALQEQARNQVTLGAVRASIQEESTAWCDGEFLHPQDRTSLIIELDELIDNYGMAAQARDFLPARTVLTDTAAG